MTVAARLPEGDERKLRQVMHREGLDKSSATRKILELGLAEWRKEEALAELREGRLSLSAAARFAGVSVWEMIDLVRERKVEHIRISREELEKEMKLLVG